MEENKTPEADIQPNVALEDAAPKAVAPRQFTETEINAAREEATRKARKKRRRGFYDLFTRILMIVIVVYVLLFQIIGVTTMPNGDMYPRIDAGDLVLFYRLDKDVRAQDIIAFEKKAGDIGDYAEPELTDIPDEGEAQSDQAAEAAEIPANTPATDELTPAERVEDQSLLGKLNRVVYNVERWLRLRGEDGAQLYICRVVAGPGDTVEVPDDGGLIVNGNRMVESNIFSQTTPYVGFVDYPLTLGPDECFVMADHRSGGADSRFFGPVKQSEILGSVITIARRNNL